MHGLFSCLLAINKIVRDYEIEGILPLSYYIALLMLFISRAFILNLHQMLKWLCGGSLNLILVPIYLFSFLEHVNIFYVESSLFMIVHNAELSYRYNVKLQLQHI